MPVQRVIIEPGVRWDRDSFVGRDYYSPRIAGTVLISNSSETKLSAGIGIYYDRANLALASNGGQGTRTMNFPLRQRHFNRPLWSIPACLRCRDM